MNEPRFSTAQWLSWLGAIAAMVGAITAYAFSNFETKSDHDRSYEHVDKRFDKLEGKVDQVLRFQKGAK